MDAIHAAAAKHGLLVIEDAAHALGSELDGEPCGRLGDAGCFSFFPNKNMTTGEGGMVVFREEDAAAAARSLRSHAMTTLTWDRHRGHATGYDVVDLGFNYRIDEMRAALGSVQISRMDELNEVRTKLADRYRDRLAGSAFAIPSFGPRGRSAHHLEVVVSSSRGRARPRTRATPSAANPDQRPLPAGAPIQLLPRPRRSSFHAPRRSPTGFSRCRSTRSSPTPTSTSSATRSSSATDARRTLRGRALAPHPALGERRRRPRPRGRRGLGERRHRRRRPHPLPRLDLASRLRSRDSAAAAVDAASRTDHG